MHAHTYFCSGAHKATKMRTSIYPHDSRLERPQPVLIQFQVCRESHKKRVDIWISKFELTGTTKTRYPSLFPQMTFEHNTNI